MYLPLQLGYIPPKVFMPFISELDNLFFWSSLHFGQESGQLGSDDLLFFGLRFNALHCGGQKFGQSRGGVKFAKLPPTPQSQKMAKNGQFCGIIPQMLNIELLFWL